MEIKISVDETKFKDVIEKELNAFSSEELHEIIRECIIKALRNNDIYKGLFIKPKNYSYEQDRPTEVLLEAARSIDLSSAYSEIQEKIINELKTNYVDLLQKIMLNTIIDGLTESWKFRENLEQAMRDIVRKQRFED